MPAPERTVPPAIVEGAAPHEDLEAIEIALLLEAVYRCYDFDFRGYASASLKRRSPWASGTYLTQTTIFMRYVDLLLGAGPFRRPCRVTADRPDDVSHRTERRRRRGRRRRVALPDVTHQ